MAYNTLIDRTGAAALIPEDASKEIIKNVAQQSAIMRMARRLPNMSRKQRRLPVASALATAYFVSPSDTGKKQTTSVSWENVYIEAEELAVIVPIPEAVLDDADFDIWGEVRPSIEEAFGLAFDQAVLYGTGAPGTWPTALVTQANTAGNLVSLAAYTDLYDAVLGETGLLSKIETDGFFVNGHAAHLSMRGKLRGARDADGQPIFRTSPTGAFPYELDGVGLDFPRNGSIDSAQSLLISGDWTQLVYAMRQDITYKILDQAVITDGNGAIQFNLAQQDMVALRAVMRLGWQLPNPINRIQGTKADRLAFGVLTA